MSNKFLASLMFSTVLMASATSFAAGNNGIAAVVNGKNIKVDDIKVAYEANPALKEKTSFEDFYGKTLNIFVDGEIVYQEAVKVNVENDADYQKQLKALKEELARKIYLEKEVRKQVTDEAVKKLYQDYKNTFNGEKEVKAKHILVKDEATAKEVIAKFQKNGDFEKLAKEYSKEPADLGYFTKQMMVPEFGDAAFKLKKGEYTKTPVKTQFGYHVILVEDVREAKPQALEKIEPQLKGMLAQKAMGDIIKGLKGKAEVVKYDVEGKVIND
jgi:peptidyl-prolyl cis-trans isomerase C